MRRLLPLFFLIAACANEQPATTTSAAKAATPPMGAPLSPQKTAEMIATSAELSEYRFTDTGISIPVAKAMRNEPAQKIADAFKKAGWIGFDSEGTLILTQKAANDRRFIMRPNGILDIVPLARKQFGAVTGWQPNEEDRTAAVPFTWSWVPNELGALVPERFEGEQKAQATLFWDGTEWSVLSIK